jgi:ferredoxin--NADP+ reductase
MPEILAAEYLSDDIKRFRIFAPKIAQKRKAGQFVIVRVSETGERIPLTIADSDPKEGSITLIVQGIGKTTKKMNQLKQGEFIRDLVGPLGKPSEISKYGTAVVIGGGVGTAIALPTAKALKQAGNHVISIIGAKRKYLVILEQEMKKISDELFVTTDDGSYGCPGFVTDQLKAVLNERSVDFVLAIGPIPMMKCVADITKPYEIKTVASLNPVMVDGTGMCGGCRVNIGGETQFVCVDGPEFDAHLVDFDTLMRRNTAYMQQERQSLDGYREPTADHDGPCKLDSEIQNTLR